MNERVALFYVTYNAFESITNILLIWIYSSLTIRVRLFEKIWFLTLHKNTFMNLMKLIAAICSSKGNFTKVNDHNIFCSKKALITKFRITLSVEFNFMWSIVKVNLFFYVSKLSFKFIPLKAYSLIHIEGALKNIKIWIFCIYL